MEVASSQCPGHVLAFNHATQEEPCFRSFFWPCSQKIFLSKQQTRHISNCEEIQLVWLGHCDRWGEWDKDSRNALFKLSGRTGAQLLLEFCLEWGIHHMVFWELWEMRSFLPWASFCHCCPCRFDSLHILHTGCGLQGRKVPRDSHWALYMFFHPICLLTKSIQSTSLCLKGSCGYCTKHKTNRRSSPPAEFTREAYN